MLPLQLAWSFAREGLTQTVLVVAGVTVGVGAYVFITATMVGVQASMVDSTLGTQAHLTVLDEPPPLVPVLDRPGVVDRTVQTPEPRARPFDQWQRTLARVEVTPGVVAACPRLTGAALAVRGGTQQSVQVVGADPDRLAQIIELPAHLTAGTYAPDGEQAVLGAGLARELGVSVGRSIVLQVDDTEATVRVVGIVELGASALDDRWVVLGLRRAQSVLGRPGDVSAIDATVTDVFEAATIAAAVEARTGQPTESWIERNGALLQALSAQDQSTVLIRVFMLLAVAMGIASVLAVTVVQREGQIGILRAMGVTAPVVMRVFLWQGALLGVAGALLGTLFGALAGLALGLVVPFSIEVDLHTAVTATGISVGTGVIAAMWPARIAARMDPAAAIRGDGG